MNRDKVKNYIYSMCDGKSVLHLGFAGFIDNYDGIMHAWDFQHLTKRASSVLGVDIDRILVSKAQKLGYSNVMVGDAQNLNLEKKFDCIYAGELIEHLEDLRGFFESIKRHSTPETKIILTTPNPFAINNFFRILFYGSPRVLNEHVNFVCKDNIEELCRRHDMRIKEFRFFTPYDQRSGIFKLKSTIVGMIAKIRPAFNTNYLIVISIS